MPPRSSDLTGRKVLVVEDDYFVALNTTDLLRQAGADIVGPCPSADLALGLIQSEGPTHAVLDVNLGNGPDFAIAHHLQSQEIPFIFYTACRPPAMPEALEKVCLLCKPASPRELVNALAAL